jgi:DNA-binding response OmpR family regulator
MSMSTILIADDEQAIARFLALHLRRLKHEVILAADGAQALMLTMEHLPDLIVLDVDMPFRNGFDVLADLKADPRTQHIPVIFCTALSAEGYEVQGLAQGADDYISKPFSLPILVARIDAVLRRAAIVRELAAH